MKRVTIKEAYIEVEPELGRLVQDLVTEQFAQRSLKKENKRGVKNESQSTAQAEKKQQQRFSSKDFQTADITDTSTVEKGNEQDSIMDRDHQKLPGIAGLIRTDKISGKDVIQENPVTVNTVGAGDKELFGSIPDLAVVTMSPNKDPDPVENDSVERKSRVRSRWQSASMKIKSQTSAEENPETPVIHNNSGTRFPELRRQVSAEENWKKLAKAIREEKKILRRF